MEEGREELKEGRKVGIIALILLLDIPKRFELQGTGTADYLTLFCFVFRTGTPKYLAIALM